jgi:hypothetical protein
MSKKEEKVEREKMNQGLLGLDEKSLTLIGVPSKVPQIGIPLRIGKKLHHAYKGIGKKTEKVEKSKIGSKFTNKSIMHGVKKIFKLLNKRPKNKKVETKNKRAEKVEE